MTLILSGTDGLSDVDGSAATPAIRGTDANTGIFFGADIIGFAEGGAEVARFNADAQFVAAAGTALLPVITTTGDVNTGIFFPAADTIAFSEGGVESMRIDSSGRVGIGTDSPAAKLHVDSTTSGQMARFNSTAANGGYITGYSSGTGVWDLGTAIQAFATGSSTDVGLTSRSGFLGFGTASIERMRIDSSGGIGIRATSIDANYLLQVGDQSVDGRAPIKCEVATTASRTQIGFRNSSGIVGSISTSGSTTSYNTSSDYRLKNTIAPMTGALAKVAQLKPVAYKWNVDDSDGEGFIAHELQEVVPYAVSGEKDGKEMQGVDYGKITPLLTAALQEAIAKIETLEARIAVLEAK